MKTRILSLAMIMGLSSISLFAKSDKTETFEVAGNCGMCEARIEKAAEKITVLMNVFDPLPEVSFAAFLTNPFLESTPRILQVIMSPHGKDVIVH